MVEKNYAAPVLTCYFEINIKPDCSSSWNNGHVLECGGAPSLSDRRRNQVGGILARFAKRRSTAALQNASEIMSLRIAPSVSTNRDE